MNKEIRKEYVKLFIYGGAILITLLLVKFGLWLFM